MKTNGTVCGTTEHQRNMTSAVEIPHEMSHLQPLADLLAHLTEHEPFVWSHTFPIGTAGTVTITYNLDPCKLNRRDRDALLSIATKLTNWGSQ